VNSLRLAFSFLTVLPVAPSEYKAGDLGRASLWFSLIGLVIGGVLVGARILIAPYFPPLLCAGLVVALWAFLTGGLHLDGLGDCCDGFFAVATPERRLEIMRDPRLGAFGQMGLTLFLILKVLAVSALQETPLESAPLSESLFALLFAPALARWLILVVASQRPARANGMAADFSAGLTRVRIVAAAVVPCVLAGLGGKRAMIATALACVVTLSVIRLARKRIGGVTGDVYGFAGELSELCVLLVFAARIAP
jgi:adenosylcobinamide-GDP ribazoletransferase